MITHLKNFIEKKRYYNWCEIQFRDNKENQDLTFSKEYGHYTIYLTTYKKSVKKDIFRVSEKEFYKKMSEVLENTLYNPNNYNLTNWKKTDFTQTITFN